MRTLIQNGLLIDPANRVQAKLNLLLEGGRVAAVTRETLPAERVIDARRPRRLPRLRGHPHARGPRRPDGRIQRCIFDAMLRMGVTSVAAGNCGENVCDPARYLDIVERDGAPVNVAMFAGHGDLRVRAGRAE